MATEISLLSEDEDDAVDMESVKAIIEYQNAHGKRMRHVGEEVVQTGKRCMEYVNDVLENDARASKAHKDASDAYQLALDDVHAKYASEIQKRDDALSNAAAAAADKDKAVGEANSEIQRLQALISKQQTDAAAALAQYQTQTAAATATVATPVSGLAASDSIDMIITDAIHSLNTKLSMLQPAQPVVAPAAPAPPAPLRRTWIKQKNTNPSYNTEREITYASPSLKRTSSSGSDGKWFFDASDKKNDPTAADQPHELTDPTTITALKTLGTFTAARKNFKPKLGNKCTYTNNTHTYEVEVVYEVPPWATAAYQQKLTQPQPAVVQQGSIGKQMLLEGPFVRPSQNDIDRYGADLDTNVAMSKVVGHKKLAELATLWSSHSQGFVYDEQKTTLWVKPKWLATWLGTLDFGDHEIRVVGHGVRSGDFDKLADDPRGFDMAMTNPGRAQGDGSRGYGIYCSPLDGIPSEYTRTSGQHKDGTMVLGLLQVPKPGPAAGSASSSTTSYSNSYNVLNGALEFYHLGCSRANYIAGNTDNDAYNVRDQTLFLPLGVVIPK